MKQKEKQRETEMNEIDGTEWNRMAINTKETDETGYQKEELKTNTES